MACDYLILTCAAHWEDSRVTVFEFIALSLPQDREASSISQLADWNQRETEPKIEPKKTK